MARENQTRSLVLGAERQFHGQAGYLCDLVVNRLLDYRERSWLKQREGLIELMARFFRHKSIYPALIWAAPIWMRTKGVWQRAGELVTHDETGRVARRGPTAAYSNDHRLRFAGGQSVRVNVKQLEFFYPKPSTTLLHVPRTRRLYTPAGILVGSGYEEGLGLGDPGEKRSLAVGNYSPNELFFRSGQGLEWLDLMSVTFARFSPEPPPEPRSFSGGRILSTRRSFVSRLANELDALVQGVPSEELPSDANVSFLRLTFVPEDFKIVVLLAAERSLTRFIIEHDGLAQLLVERLGAERIKT